MPLLPFFQPASDRGPRQRKSDPRARLCYFLNFGYNHGHDCHNLLDAETGKVVFSHDVTWHHREAPLILLATAVGNPPTAPPKDIYVLIPTPVPSVAESAPASVRLLLRRLQHQRLYRSCAGTRVNYATTAYTNDELLGFDPPARQSRIGTWGVRGDNREDALRDPCTAQCITGICPSPWATIGPCGLGINVGKE